MKEEALDCNNKRVSQSNTESGNDTPSDDMYYGGMEL